MALTSKKLSAKMEKTKRKIKSDAELARRDTMI
jgi:hypothetical protein